MLTDCYAAQAIPVRVKLHSKVCTRLAHVCISYAVKFFVKVQMDKGEEYSDCSECDVGNDCRLPTFALSPLCLWAVIMAPQLLARRFRVK